MAFEDDCVCVEGCLGQCLNQHQSWLETSLKGRRPPQAFGPQGRWQVMSACHLQAVPRLSLSNQQDSTVGDALGRPNPSLQISYHFKAQYSLSRVLRKALIMAGAVGQRASERPSTSFSLHPNHSHHISLKRTKIQRVEQPAEQTQCFKSCV